MQVDALADAGTESACVVADPRGAREAHGVDLVGDLFGEPQPHVRPAAARIVTRLQTPQQDARGGRRDRHATEWRAEDQQAHDDDPQRGVGQHLEPGEQPQNRRGREQVEHPADAGEDEQRHAQHRLHPLHAPWRRLGAMEALGRVLVQRSAEGLGHCAQPRHVVDVGDGELGHPRADARDELRGGERTATEVEEVDGAVGDRHAEHRLPLRREPRFARRKVGCRDLDVRQRPRQRGAVDLARRADGQLVDDGQQRNHRRGKTCGEVGARGDAVEVGRCGEVADQHRHAALGRADGGGRPGDSGQILQRRLDFAELDAASADLHLIVRATLEDQAFRFEAHEIPRAVGALPAERRHRRILLGILRRIKITCQADAADDELTHATLRHGLPLPVHDRECPAVQRQADTDGAIAAERRSASHDGRLGRAVRVPHFATLGRETCGKLGRAGLTAEDEQAHVLDGIRRPHRGQRRHRRHNRDALAQQPRREVFARAHERARRGHETCAVPPRQPHLFTRGIERDRQAREHAVVRPQGRLLEEDARFRVDECCRRAVRHRDALGHARRARGEDDPRVILGRRRRHGDDRVCRGVRRIAREQRRSELVLGVGCRHVLAGPRDDTANVGFAEDQPRTLVGIIGVDGHVRRACGEDPQDRDVQLLRAGGHPHTDAVAATHAGPV